MTQRGPIAKAFSVLLALAVGVAVVPTTSAQEGASLTGTIYADGGLAPLDGAVLHAGDLRTGEIYSSTRTGASGEFELSGLPAAAYELAIESQGGLYIIETPVEMKAGQHRAVQLALSPDAAPDPASATRKKRSMWDKPVWATLFVIGGAFALGALLSGLDNENQGLQSPFSMN